jgi:predicted metal-dependent HD superfamily phosphohydrolase
MESELINKAKEYAESVLAKTPKDYSYHCAKHTHEVVDAVLEIGQSESLSRNDLETALVAAWFHDTGYAQGHEQHEQRAATTAEDLLETWGASAKKIADIRQAILATRMPQNPKTLVDQVLCDADLYHLSTKGLEESGRRLRQELTVTKKMEFTDEEWGKFNLRFLKNHRYFTTYGKTVLQDRKKKIIKKLKRKLSPDVNDDYVKKLEEEIEKLQKKSDKKATPERGIESMFRIVSQNHTTLSAMADNKSNIMISINSIILSVVVTILFRKLEEFPNLLLPTLLLVTVCLLTIVFAVLASRPHISSGKFTELDIKNKKTNLLFFGNFHGMALNNYEWGMKELMKDSDYLYSSLIKDIYFNGKVLAQKYRMLRVSYTIFMYGFVASIIGFIAAMLVYYYPAGSISF